MNFTGLQEYIDELKFKNAMFGYDKVDVDIRLEKNQGRNT